MHILVIGAAGMVGQKLTQRLAIEKNLGGKPIDRLSLADVIEVDTSRFKGRTDGFKVDLSSPGQAEKLVAERPDLIFHLAAIVSGEAEADLEKGYRINLDGTRFLFEAIYREGLKAPYRPRVVFTSSIAVFGAPFPAVIGDDFLPAPLTSYGTQKVIGEYLLSDYSRRGIFDGIGLRLPTVCVRPGKPNKAASGFFSNIIREPLNGQEAVLPVEETVIHWHASPRSAIGFLIHAATLPLEGLGNRRSLNMPGLSVAVGEQVAALRRVAGEKALKLIRRVPDDTIRRIVAGWPQNFKPEQAIKLGFRSEATFDEIIRVHIEDELEKTRPAAL